MRPRRNHVECMLITAAQPGAPRARTKSRKPPADSTNSSAARSLYLSLSMLRLTVLLQINLMLLVNNYDTTAAGNVVALNQPSG